MSKRNAMTVHQATPLRVACAFIILASGVTSMTVAAAPPAITDRITELEADVSELFESLADLIKRTAILHPDPRIIFITSNRFRGNLGGLAGADAQCNESASFNTELDGLTFKAWLSSHTVDARDRLVQGGSPYILINGAPVARNFWDLIDGALSHPISVNEFGDYAFLHSSGIDALTVWTNTGPDGTHLQNTNGILNTDCANWASESAQFNGYFGIGLGHSPSTTWTQYDQSGCNTFRRLYCIQQ